jgi:hypothetical protein
MPPSANAAFSLDSCVNFGWPSESPQKRLMFGKNSRRRLQGNAVPARNTHQTALDAKHFTLLLSAETRYNSWPYFKE